MKVIRFKTRRLIKKIESHSHVPLKLPCSLGLNSVRISEQGRIFEMFCCSWSPSLPVLGHVRRNISRKRGMGSKNLRIEKLFC
jgi:hypothetical protein